MTQTNKRTTTTTIVRRDATNGHHLAVADILAFADELRRVGIPQKEAVVVEGAFDTSHPIAIRARWEEEVR